MYYSQRRTPMNPESSDPNDPETNTWWIWIPVFLTLFVLIAICVFGRELMYEARLDRIAVTLLRLNC
jgi:hypothetical protein